MKILIASTCFSLYLLVSHDYLFLVFSLQAMGPVTRKGKVDRGRGIENSEMTDTAAARTSLLEELTKAQQENENRFVDGKIS